MYNITNSQVPLAVYYGGKDRIVTPGSVKTLLSSYRNIVHSKEIEDYGHCDFVLGKDVWSVLHRDVLDVLNRLNDHRPAPKPKPPQSDKDASHPWESQGQQNKDDIRESDVLEVSQHLMDLYTRMTGKKLPPGARKNGDWQAIFESTMPEKDRPKMRKVVEGFLKSTMSGAEGGVKNILDSGALERLKKRFLPTEFDDILGSGPSGPSQRPDRELSFDEWELKLRQFVARVQKKHGG